jgi:hypothetical protein
MVDGLTLRTTPNDGRVIVRRGRRERCCPLVGGQRCRLFGRRRWYERETAGHLEPAVVGQPIFPTVRVLDDFTTTNQSNDGFRDGVVGSAKLTRQGGEGRASSRGSLFCLVDQFEYARLIRWALTSRRIAEGHSQGKELHAASLLSREGKPLASIPANKPNVRWRRVEQERLVDSRFRRGISLKWVR